MRHRRREIFLGMPTIKDIPVSCWWVIQRIITLSEQNRTYFYIDGILAHELLLDKSESVSKILRKPSLFLADGTSHKACSVCLSVVEYKWIRMDLHNIKTFWNILCVCVCDFLIAFIYYFKYSYQVVERNNGSIRDTLQISLVMKRD